MANPIYDIPWQVFLLTPEDEALIARRKKTRRSRKGLDPDTVEIGLARSAAARVYAAAPRMFAWPVDLRLVRDAAERASPGDDRPSGLYERSFTAALNTLSGVAAFERRREAGELGPDLPYELARFGLRTEPKREANPAPRDTFLVSRLRF